MIRKGLIHRKKPRTTKQPDKRQVRDIAHENTWKWLRKSNLQREIIAA